MNWIITLFLSLGGVGIIFGIVKKNAKPLIKKGLERLMDKDHPAIREFLIKYRQQIEDLFDEIDSGVKEGLNEEAAKPTPPPAA